MRIDITKDIIKVANIFQKNKFQHQMEADEIIEGFNLFTKDINDELITVLKYLKIENLLLTLQSNEEKYQASSSFVKDALTEQEKDELDENIKESIQNLKSQINLLVKSLKEQKGFLKARSTNEYAHKELAIACLSKRLENLVNYFKGFQQHRLTQQQKLQKLLDQEQLNSKIYKMKPRREDLEKNNESQGANSENNTELEQENKLLLQTYQNDQKKIIQLQTSILAIGGVLDNLSQIVAEQDQSTEAILVVAEQSLKITDQANQNLIQALDYSKDIGYTWAMLFIGLGSVLLAYDYLKS